MFKKKTNKQFVKKENLTPRRDWQILVVVMMVLIFVGILFHLYMYYKISQEDFFEIGSIETKEVPQLKQEELERITTEFENKRALFDDYAENPATITDPS